MRVHAQVCGYPSGESAQCRVSYCGYREAMLGQCRSASIMLISTIFGGGADVDGGGADVGGRTCSTGRAQGCCLTPLDVVIDVTALAPPHEAC
eukprot:2798548-Rhodomonas_salina.1